MTAFKLLKDRKQWNPWHRSFCATATAQGLSNVLNPKYSPSTSDEQALFDMLQSYMFAVFTLTLVLAEVTARVRKYSSGPVDLVATMSSGTATHTQRINLEKQIGSSLLPVSFSACQINSRK